MPGLGASGARRALFSSSELNWVAYWAPPRLSPMRNREREIGVRFLRHFNWREFHFKVGQSDQVASGQPERGKNMDATGGWCVRLG